jgi:hypothetical protein
VSKFIKLKEKIENNNKNVKFEDIDKLLKAFGFLRRQPGSGSSHYTYSKGSMRITVPYKKPFVREVYVKQVLDLIGEDYDKEES